MVIPTARFLCACDAGCRYAGATIFSVGKILGNANNFEPRATPHRHTSPALLLAFKEEEENKHNPVGNRSAMKA
jgi:hypothetical protein